MPTFRFDLNSENAERLERDAERAMMTVQDYIRFRLFPSNDIFTVQECVRRIRERGPAQEFCIPELYSEAEWGTIGRAAAGVLGKNFYKFINTHDLGIRFIPGRRKKRCAVYCYETGGKRHE